MVTPKQKAASGILWLLPTPSEIAIYVALSIATFFAVNLEPLKNILSVPANFQLGNSILKSIDSLLGHTGQAAAPLSTAIFWGLVGVGMYVVVWTIINFSTELNNDLALTKYIHPPKTDVTLPLKVMIVKTFLRIVIVVLGIFFINMAIQVFLPLAASNFRMAFHRSFALNGAQAYLTGLLIQIATLHTIVLLVRIFCLRKRLFD